MPLSAAVAPQMHVPNQLVGAPKSTNVRLECFVEAHPKAITYWEFNDAMVMNTSRITTQTLENHYKIHMILDIRGEALTDVSLRRRDNVCGGFVALDSFVVNRCNCISSLIRMFAFECSM